MTRALATVVSWMLWPLVVVVLGWRWAWDRVRAVEVVDMVTDGHRSRAIVRYADGREIGYGTNSYGEWTTAPAHVRQACETSRIRSLIAKTKDERE